MKTFTTPVIAAGAIAAAALGFAGSANAAPMGPDVSQTVTNLQSQGFHVIVNKVGSAPLDACAVSAVRPGQTYQRMESEVPGPNDHGHCHDCDGNDRVRRRFVLTTLVATRRLLRQRQGRQETLRDGGTC